jgi:hypothetical protein
LNNGWHVSSASEAHAFSAATAGDGTARAPPPRHLELGAALSDLLFVLARRFARAEGGSEPIWDRTRSDQSGG